MSSKSEVRDATLIVLRNMIEAIEEGIMDPVSLNVENVPMMWDDCGMMMSAPSTISKIIVKTTPPTSSAAPAHPQDPQT